MADLQHLIALVKDQRLERHYIKTEVVDGEVKKIYELIFVDENNHPLPKQPLHFKSLGNGANKTVFSATLDGHSAPSGYVLCLQNSTIRSAKGELEGEAEILFNLGKKGLYVPQPFKSLAALPADFIFDVNLSEVGDGNRVKGAAYFMEQLDIRGRFIEMQKLDKPDDFIEKKVLGDKLKAPEAHKHAATTLKELHLIRTVYDAEPWADFQVLYDKHDGGLMIFDPSPVKQGIDKALVEKRLNKWEKDLEDAIKGP